MKTTFHRRFNTGSTYGKRLGYTLIALALGMLIFTPARLALLALVSPLWKGENAVARGFRNFGGMLRDKDTLVRENIALKERLSSFETFETSYRALESSRDDLLARFGRIDAPKSIAASVLVHPPFTPYDVLIIDAGSVEGVKSDDKVSLPEGGALGQVKEVDDHQSRVALYSGTGVETSAILERGNINVMLVGQGGGTFKIFLPRDTAVLPGDRILLPGVRAELVGVVSEVTLEPTDAEKHIIVGGVGNIGGIRFVAVH